MAPKLKVPPEKAKEVLQRLETDTLTPDDYRVIKEILKDSIRLGLIRIVPTAYD
jgi:hypothetical protein